MEKLYPSGVPRKIKVVYFFKENRDRIIIRKKSPLNLSTRNRELLSQVINLLVLKILSITF